MYTGTYAIVITRRAISDVKKLKLSSICFYLFALSVNLLFRFSSSVRIYIPINQNWRPPVQLNHPYHHLLRHSCLHWHSSITKWNAYYHFNAVFFPPSISHFAFANFFPLRRSDLHQNMQNNAFPCRFHSEWVLYTRAIRK